MKTVAAAGHDLEKGLSITAFAFMVALPIANLVGREVLGRGVSGTLPLIQHLTFCVAFLGAVFAAGCGQLVSLSTPGLLPERLRSGVRLMTSALAAAITFWLAYAS